MQTLGRGGNCDVNGSSVTVEVDWAGAGVEADISAYLVTEAGKVRSDADMVFDNQPSGADGAVKLASGGPQTRFEVNLANVPAALTRVVFCATVDGGKTFANLNAAEIRVAGQASFTPPREGATEAAMILGELYRRGTGWKFRAVGQGFDGGLAPLARSFGITVDDDPAPAATPAPAASPAPASSGAVSLEKKVAAKAPHLVSLAKTATITLEKKNLSTVKAQVILILDASGSMTKRYNNGTVQKVVDRILPLAVHFDDDGALDVWAYGNKPARLTPITLDNVDGYIAREGGGWLKWDCGLRGNNEPAVLEPVIDDYKKASPPAYIVFISDGGVNQNKKIEQLLRDAADRPIFWQFVGIGGSNYGIFEKLDDMPGRTVDNCNFFALDDLSDVTDAQLYDRLLDEFPGWLTAAKAAGVIK